MAQKFFVDKRPHNGLTYDQFTNLTNETIESTDESILEGTDKTLFEYKRLNSHRSQRVQKTFTVSDELKSKVAAINEKQIWMVITEDWCGDSAQNLPYIAKIADCNPLVNLRIIQRDDNLDIMDLYLTNGKSRSIPKLVAFDEKGEELFQWGPRPSEAQAMVDQWKAEGLDKNEFIEKLHLWYGRNRGAAIEAEFISLLG